MAELALKPGSLVLVTGANGLIGSHIADQLLTRGYHVRGAVRDADKAAWMCEFFASRHPNSRFELAAVPEMSQEGCYNDAVKGAQGVVHVASIMTGGAVEDVIPAVVAGGLNALKSAAKEPSVRRFVYTSSSLAATTAKPNVAFAIDETSYNYEAIEKAWNFPDGEDQSYKGMYIYAASKAQTEREMWDWVTENKPEFVFNTVLPNCNYGKVLHPEKQGCPSTCEWPKLVFEGSNVEYIAKVVLPQWFVNTVDDALVHVAALIYEDVKNERIFAFAEPFTWNKVLAIYRKLYPKREFVNKVTNYGNDVMKVPNERALELLKRCGRNDWTTLEESLKELTADLV